MSSRDNLGGIIHTYQKYDPVNLPSPTAPPPDMVSPAFEHMLAYGDMREVADEHRHAFVLGDDDILDIVSAAQQAYTADQELLLSVLDIATAGVRVGFLQRCQQLRQRDLAVAHLLQIRLHFVGLRRATEADHIGNTRYGLQLAFHHPVLQLTQFVRIQVVGAQPIAKHLADRRTQRAWITLRDTAEAQRLHIDAEGSG